MTEKEIIEDKRNQLNFNIRGILTIIDLIDGDKKEYADYIANTLNENDYLDQQIKLAADAKERLVNIFKK